MLECRVLLLKTGVPAGATQHRQATPTRTVLPSVREGTKEGRRTGCLTQTPSPRRLLPEKAVGRGCLTLGGTCTP